MIVFAFGFLLFQSLTPTFTNISYGTKTLETLDVYVASSPNPTPAIIEMHPGGWAGGSKSAFAPYGGVIEKIYSRGVTVISINYPVAPTDLYPSPNNSCQRAVQFVRANAQNWNIDPTNIAGVGMSAGAHLAMWVAMAPDKQDLLSPDPVSKQSSRLRAVVSIQGPSDFTSQYYKHDPAKSPHGSPVWAYFGVTNQAQWDAIPIVNKQSASPRYQVFQSAMVANRNVSFLGVYEGDAKKVASSELPTPESNVHSLIYGLLQREALKSIGNNDAELWIGASILDGAGKSYPGDTIADWLNMRLRSQNLSNYGFGTPGCYGSQILLSNGDAALGNNNFLLKSYLADPNGLGAIFMDTSVQAAFSDPFGVGIRMLLDPTSPNFMSWDASVNSLGMLNLIIAVPNNPVLSGQTFYAQGATAWTSAVPAGCVPSPLGLTTTNVLRIRVP